MYFRLLVLSAVDDECDAGMDQDEIEKNRSTDNNRDVVMMMAASRNWGVLVPNWQKYRR